MPRVDFKCRARLLKAVAHPSRLQMLEALADRERCVGELRDLVGADLSTVSKHLAVMKSAGLVSDRKQGLQVYYSLRVPCVLGFIACMEEAIAGVASPRPGACCSSGAAPARGEA